MFFLITQLLASKSSLSCLIFIGYSPHLWNVSSTFLCLFFFFGFLYTLHFMIFSYSDCNICSFIMIAFLVWMCISTLYQEVLILIKDEIITLALCFTFILPNSIIRLIFQWFPIKFEEDYYRRTIEWVERKQHWKDSLYSVRNQQIFIILKSMVHNISITQSLIQSCFVWFLINIIQSFWTTKVWNLLQSDVYTIATSKNVKIILKGNNNYNNNSLYKTTTKNK